ncbi:MAG: MFS transporter [Oscillospiraceae bacterium]|nr:MFS transporter [Oscillospiraceae bacterium]
MIHLLLVIIYLSFISLGLPDGLLSAGWPSMYGPLGVDVSFAGIISMIICAGTILSSLMSDWLTHKLGAGKVTALSVATTALALIGFSISDRFWMLCLWAIPYGLGAGSVDAALNNYVALHYSSRHMSWLHCMWGIGASTGPYVMGMILSGGGSWTTGYWTIGLLQIVLTAILLFSLPLWKDKSHQQDAPESQPLPLTQVIQIPGAWEIMVTFFCYCALEQTAALWSGSYLALLVGYSGEEAASLASLFFLGMTVGRALSGFLTMKLDDTKMIRLGFVIIALGIVTLMLPFGSASALPGLLLVGLGCAPIYPCVIHSTPHHFGPERSQALIGIQMAAAYVGTALMPPLFGLIAQHLSLSLLAPYLLILLLLMITTHHKMLNKCR